MPAQPSLSILAVVYTDGLAADKLLAAWGYALRTAGLSVAGLVQGTSKNSMPLGPVRVCCPDGMILGD